MVFSIIASIVTLYVSANLGCFCYFCYRCEKGKEGPTGLALLDYINGQSTRTLIVYALRASLYTIPIYILVSICERKDPGFCDFVWNEIGKDVFEIPENQDK